MGLVCVGGRPGSSPRMRGARSPARAGTWSAGIIPAYAGSTQFRRCPRGFFGDHPRVCGEHLDEIAEAARAQGSSPRMRGARRYRRHRVWVGGIIPAYAGSTPFSGVTGD